ncbi:HDOD domain-containing protein [Sulfurimonas aquatica]|uniref:HDOD domain-containing protein n=1 Tax=Sulfurimonas aquatica TaxID=2672570 RepID=A0A975B2D0_9BACT|nr:HDOD domain-containing protein [Sulfurimonas aquatica]QSZ42961.1 HDOD domain-containing protein [Sulfurimonas aquatica]
MGFESIVERVKAIPPLPASVVKMEELYARGNPELKKLVKIVEEDPVLTANILAAVNSPLYSFSHNVITVHQAVTLFGMSSVRGFVLSSAKKSTFDLDMSPYGITNEEFQNISTLQSMLMFQWYMSIDVEKANLLVPIAFLMDIGQIIIAKEVSQSDYKDEFTRMIQEEASISQTEKLFTGMSSAEVTALLFEHWNFNETFVEIIRNSDEPSLADREYQQYCEAVDVVKTCINIQNKISDKSFKNSKLKALSYGFKVDRYIKTVERIRDKANL